MSDAENSSSISQFIKKISHRNLSDNHSESANSLKNMESSPESPSPQLRESAYQNDSRFRKYVQLVEKNLSSFDAVNEWADIISFLGRLLKSFQAYPQFPIIPRKQLVAKRLAQCLNPGFPAGVHQKTLEVYAFILKTIGLEQLSEDLALWSTGLFPFVQYATTHVKPQLLALFEKFYLPLHSNIRPAMRGFIIALLPALEEEGSEYFDKVVALIEALSETVELPFFYSCVWLVMISNPSLRSPALNYLLRKLPKIDDREAVALVLGGKENVSLMIRAFATTLADQQLLVQRGLLELLVQNFSLKSRMIPHDDLVILMRSALAIVLRKDMSLNRRLYVWLLGNESKSQAQSIYFNSFAEKSATQAIGSMMHMHEDGPSQQQQQQQQQQKPYKILISLMDKWEIGQPIVNNVFVDSIHSLFQKKHEEDVMQTANMWMDMMEPYLICMKLFELIDATTVSGSGKGPSATNTAALTNIESLNLVEFTLTSFQLTDEEIKQIHFPLLLASISKKLQMALKNPKFIEMLPQASLFISLIVVILRQLPESVFVDRLVKEGEDDKERKQFVNGEDVLEYAREFYNVGGLQSPRLQQQNQLNEEELENETNEEGGDLSSTANMKTAQGFQQQMQQRPEFVPLRGSVLLKEVVDNLIEFLIEFANSYIVLPTNLSGGVDVGAEGKRLGHIEHQLERVFLGTCTALTLTSKYTSKDLQLGNSKELTYVLLECCQQAQAFGVIDAGLSTITYLIQQKQFVHDTTILRKPHHLKKIIDRLWGFLSSPMQLLHMRTVELLWSVTNVSLPHQIETIISNYLIHPDGDHERLAAYEKFGVIWELSESVPEASIVLSRPMFLMLDLLKEGASPLDRRAGETWIRCHLKSYVRLLEPFILTMLNRHIIRSSAVLNVTWENQILLTKNKKLSLEDNGHHKVTSILYFSYPKAFDSDVIDYMFTTLNTLITFGGLNVLKACKNHFVDNEGPVGKLVQTVFDMDQSNNQQQLSFLDLLVMISIRFLESEPGEKMAATLTKPNQSVQLHATDLLYLIISKLDFVNMKLVTQIQTSALHKLLFCISKKDLNTQQKLLHLLHACLAIASASSSSNSASKEKPNGLATKQHGRQSSVDSVASTLPQNNMNEAIQLVQSSSDLLVKCISDAFTIRSNQSLLQHWMDFLLATLPYLKHGFRHIVVPILITVCHQLGMHCDAIEAMIHEKPDGAGQAGNSCAGKEMTALLLGFEKIVMFCLTERVLNDDWFITSSKQDKEKEGDDVIPIPCIAENSPLVGLAHIVTIEERNGSSSKSDKARDAIMYHLPILLQILLNAWHAFRQPNWSQETTESMGEAKVDAILHSFSYTADQSKARIESILEKLFKYSTIDFVEGLTEIFFMENQSALEFDLEGQEQQQRFNMIGLDMLSNTPTNSPQHVISCLLDSIRQRTPNMYQKRRKILRSGKLTDTSILRFAEIYCGYINNPESILLLWPIIHSFSKDYLSQASTYRTILPGLMRFLTVALEELTKSDGYEQDRRIRKDAYELYQRCIDYCILISGKSFDQSLWMRGRSTIYDDSLAMNGSLNDDSSSIHTIDSNNVNENTVHSVESITRNTSYNNVSELEKKTSWKSREDVMINQVNQYLAAQVIPRLRLLIGDNDKINSLLNNLVYYVIGPALKSRTKSPVVLDQLCEMSRMPHTYKTWKKEIWEVFVDNRFFQINITTVNKWTQIIGTAFSIEKERMADLMGRITTSPSSTLFSNKDIEALNRSLNLRRLSFVLFAGIVDQYVQQLPIIQEKIVELLKLDHGEMIHVEIFLCLRIILIRFSQKHLMNFWPVLITELMRLFNSFVYSDFQDRTEEAQIALAGCKFLDLLCTLELDAFQIYQWIFIRDTIETLIKPQDSGPIPIMELLDDKISHHHSNVSSITMDAFTMDDMTNVPSGYNNQISLGSLKRPMLTMHAIQSIRQLQFFIEHVGLYVYQSSFTLAKPDLPFIESLLQNDLIDQDLNNNNTLHG